MKALASFLIFSISTTLIVLPIKLVFSSVLLLDGYDEPSACDCVHRYGVQPCNCTECPEAPSCVQPPTPTAAPAPPPRTVDYRDEIIRDNVYHSHVFNLNFATKHDIPDNLAAFINEVTSGGTTTPPPPPPVKNQSVEYGVPVAAVVVEPPPPKILITKPVLHQPVEEQPVVVFKEAKIPVAEPVQLLPPPLIQTGNPPHSPPQVFHQDTNSQYVYPIQVQAALPSLPPLIQSTNNNPPQVLLHKENKESVHVYPVQVHSVLSPQPQQPPPLTQPVNLPDTLLLQQPPHYVELPIITKVEYIKQEHSPPPPPAQALQVHNTQLLYTPQTPPTQSQSLQVHQHNTPHYTQHHIQYIDNGNKYTHSAKREVVRFPRSRRTPYQSFSSPPPLLPMQQQRFQQRCSYMIFGLRICSNF